MTDMLFDKDEKSQNRSDLVTSLAEEVEARRRERAGGVFVFLKGRRSGWSEGRWWELSWSGSSPSSPSCPSSASSSTRLCSFFPSLFFNHCFSFSFPLSCINGNYVKEILLVWLELWLPWCTAFKFLVVRRVPINFQILCTTSKFMLLGTVVCRIEIPIMFRIYSKKHILWVSATLLGLLLFMPSFFFRDLYEKLVGLIWWDHVFHVNGHSTMLAIISSPLNALNQDFRG